MKKEGRSVFSCVHVGARMILFKRCSQYFLELASIYIKLNWQCMFSCFGKFVCLFCMYTMKKCFWVSIEQAILFNGRIVGLRTKKMPHCTWLIDVLVESVPSVPYVGRQSAVDLVLFSDTEGVGVLGFKLGSGPVSHQALYLQNLLWVRRE